MSGMRIPSDLVNSDLTMAQVSKVKQYRKKRRACIGKRQAENKRHAARIVEINAERQRLMDKEAQITGKPALPLPGEPREQSSEVGGER